MVIGDDNVQIISRNYGEHDGKFFIVKIMTNVYKAIETAKDNAPCNHKERKVIKWNF